MISGARNAYVTEKFVEVFESTEVLFIMAAFVILAGCIAWLFMRGLYGEKVTRLRYVLFWMILTQLIYMSLFELVRGYLNAYDVMVIAAVRIGLWFATGLIVSAMPLVHRALHLSLLGRAMYLVVVQVAMRVIVFTVLGVLFAYGLQYPKLLSKVSKIAPACRDALTCVIKDL